MRPGQGPRCLMRPRGHRRGSIMRSGRTPAHYSIIITASAPIIGTWASPASMRFRLNSVMASSVRRRGSQTSSDIVDQAGVVDATSMVMRRLRHLASNSKLSFSWQNDARKNTFSLCCCCWSTTLPHFLFYYFDVDVDFAGSEASSAVRSRFQGGAKAPSACMKQALSPRPFKS